MSAADVRELERPVVVRAWVAAALQAVATVMSIAPIIATVEIARRLLSGQRGGVWAIAWIAVGLLVLRAALYLAAAGLSHLADADLGAILRRRVADRLERLPLGWFAGGVTARVGGVMDRDVSLLHHAVAHDPGDYASAVAGPVVTAAYLFWVDWRLALLTVAVVAAAQSVRMRLAARASDPARRVAAANAELMAAAVETVHAIDVIKTFGASADGPPRFAAAAAAYVDADEEAQRIFVRQRSLTRATVAPATIVLVLGGCGIAFAAASWTEPSAVLAFVVLGVGLFDQLTPIYAARGRRAQARAAAGRIASLLREPVEATVDDAAAQAPRRPLRVEFDSVRFGYGEGAPVINGVDAVLEPGTVTALVGPSGAGKSTLASLLARFYDVTEGAIRLGGVDVREMKRDVLYKHVGFLFQDVVLLRRSIRDNLTLGAPHADDETVAAAAKAASIHERILALPRGYDSVVGEDAQLSGGERQRVAIARTLLCDTPVLVLDEATAYADPESEAAVQDALSELAARRTVLVIAHRLHTITGADQILVLDQGRVVERGRHADLLAADGHYGAMWRAQGGLS
jgi:ATP-binding cassette subfamily B protein